MNQQESNQLGQYTVPTTPREQAFYSRHSGAITRYTFAVIGIQFAWSFFSYNPAMALLQENTTMLPELQPFLPLLSGAILGILHFVLKAETLETFSNVMDKDETTINGAWNYLIPIIVCIGLFALDVKGVSTTLRDTSYEGKKAFASSESKSELAKAKLDYDMSITAINQSVKEGVAAESLPFASQLSQARSIRTWDAQDVAAKNRKIAAIAQQRDAAVAKVRIDANEAKKEALRIYNSEKSRITGIVDSTHKSLDGQDSKNAEKADAYSWGVSVFFMLIFLLMNYKLVYLRVNSGIRINKEFTQLDAEGSFLEKLQRVITSIAQRQGHRFLVFFHKIGSTGTATLSTFDGRVILQQSSYNGSQVTTPSVLALPNINNGDLNNGDNGTIAPPPPPPLPPSSNGGGDDDRRTPPQLPAAPVPSNAIQQPQTATASAVATLPKPSPSAIQSAVEDLGYGQPLSHATWDEVLKLATAYDKPRPTPSVETQDKNWNDGAAFIPDPTPSVKTKELNTAYHEAGHAVTYFNYCVENYLTPLAFELSLNPKGGGHFIKFAKGVPASSDALMKMAGFAGECLYQNANRKAFLKDVLKNQQYQPDIKSAIELVKTDEHIELAFQRAYSIIQDHAECHNELAKTLFEQKELDYVDTIAIAKKYFKFYVPNAPLLFDNLDADEIADMLKYLKYNTALANEFTLLCKKINPALEKVAMTAEGKKVFAPSAFETLRIAKLALAKIADTPTPSVETPKTPVTTVTTPVTVSKPPVTEITVTTPISVTTPVTPVTTGKSDEKNEHGDKVLKEMKRGFQLEIGNITSKNGNYETVMKRIIRKNAEFDNAMKAVFAKQLTVSTKVRQEMTTWVADNIEPLILSYLNKEGSND